jgi:hypothetical protein
MNTEVDDTVFATVQRLNDVRSRQPPPLVSHEASQQRDSPIHAKLSLIVPKRAPNAHRAAPPHAWNWKSKGT